MDVTTGRWEAVSSMGTQRSGCAAVVHGQHIYAIGGHDGSRYLQTVERMDTSTGRWEAVSSMGTQRSGMGTRRPRGVGACMDSTHICVVVRWAAHLTVERMDIATEAVGGGGQHRLLKRYGCAAVVHGQHIYATGGYDAGALLETVERMDVTTGRWEAVSSMGTKRMGCAAVVHGQHIYAIGGRDGHASLETVERMDMPTGRWEAVGSMGTKREGCVAAMHGQHIYAIGGDAGGAPLDTVERMDMMTGRWVAVSSMGTKRRGCAAAVHGRHIYAIGGRDGLAHLETVERMDMMTGRWEAVGSMGTKRYRCAAVMHGRHIYAIGGHDGHAYLDTAERMDVTTGRWQAVGSMGTKRYGCAAVVHGQHIYAIGGYDEAHIWRRWSAWAVTTGRWEAVGSMVTKAPRMDTKREGCAGLVHGQHIYAIGGHDGHAYLETVERMDVPTGRWEAVGSMGTKHRGCAAVVHGQHVYVIGGHDGLAHLETMERMDVTTGRWEAVSSMGTKRHGCAAVVHGQHIYAIGGHDGGAHLETVERMDVTTGRWEAVGSMGSKREGCAAVVHGRHIYAIGGYGGRAYLETVERMDVTTGGGGRRWYHGHQRYEHIYAVGGYDEHAQLEKVERMDVTTGRWEAVGSMGSKREGVCGGGGWEAIGSMGSERYGCAAVMHGRHVYAIGGYGGGADLDTAERMDVTTGRWEVVGSMGTKRYGMSTKRHGCAAVVNGHRIYVLGGRHDGGTHLETVERFQMDGKEAAPAGVTADAARVAAEYCAFYSLLSVQYRQARGSRPPSEALCSGSAPVDALLRLLEEGLQLGQPAPGDELPDASEVAQRRASFLEKQRVVRTAVASEMALAAAGADAGDPGSRTGSSGKLEGAIAARDRDRDDFMRYLRRDVLRLDATGPAAAESSERKARLASLQAATEGLAAALDTLRPLQGAGDGQVEFSPQTDGDTPETRALWVAAQQSAAQTYPAAASSLPVPVLEKARHALAVHTLWQGCSDRARAHTEEAAGGMRGALDGLRDLFAAEEDGGESVDMAAQHAAAARLMEAALVEERRMTALGPPLGELQAAGSEVLRALRVEQTALQEALLQVQGLRVECQELQGALDLKLGGHLGELERSLERAKVLHLVWEAVAIVSYRRRLCSWG
ncbi:hypothetical protein CYMTET_24306 [Cymbomonas tetramitiformis]|uniref:Uncharacterized protein n=1 Tax=Cymbomonas tetramitiformis TaxID=36881 RepID=A0AAE0FW61_9CHLO|nr:hypothetical protein CYMTET_24306 [Cymbomonas tetramitiformis]